MKTPSPNETEIEWQFDALDLRPVERWLAALSGGRIGDLPETGVASIALATVRVQARPAERLVDAYFDTADWRIGRSKHVLRVRNRGARQEVTLKDFGQAVGALRRRLEVTEALPADGVAALGAEGPVGWRLRALAGKRPLQTILEVRTRRRPFDLFLGSQRVAEVALDETVIIVGADHQPMRLQRVEVEVEPQWVDQLRPTVEQLRRECGLQPAALTKFEAGLLAAGLRVPPPPELGSVTFDSSPTVGEVAFAVLRRHFSALLAHEFGTRLGEDIEELHDMRVATRRTRAALSLFEDALPVRARHVRLELGWLAGVLGAVRDLDVQMERLDEWSREVPEEDRGELSDLAALLRRERSDARRALLTCLDSARFERLVSGFTAMLRQGPSRRSATARSPAVVVIPDLVRAQHRSATKAARRARRSGDAADFHTTRIRLKRLRYLLEFVSPIYDKRTDKYLRCVVKLQDGLGAMQDARVAAAQLHKLAAEEGSVLSPVTVFVMGGVAQRYRDEAERRTKSVTRRLGNLSDGEWRRLSAVIERRRLDLNAQYRWPGPAPATTVGTRVPSPPGASEVQPEPTFTPGLASVPPTPALTAVSPVRSLGPDRALDRRADTSTSPGTSPGPGTGPLDPDGERNPHHTHR